MRGALSRRALLALGASALGVVALGGAVSAVGCGEEDKAPADRGAALGAFVDVVALPSLEELRTQAVALATALDALATQATLDALTAARSAWDAARGAYRRTVAFGIGPGDDIAITGGIIDEPTDQAKLDALIALDPPVDETKVRSAAASARGFLAIEALLFTADAPIDQVLAGYTTDPQAKGRSALARALGVDLRDKLVAIADGWAPGKGDFGGKLRSAGAGSSVFAAQRDAFDALLNQALAIEDRTIDIVRASAGVTPDPKAPSADRSDRTINDLVDDLMSIESLYSCKFRNQTGASISSIVAEVNKGADDAMSAALADARAALGTFAAPLRGAAAARQAEVDGLITRLRSLKAALSVGVFNALGVSVGISDKDGD